jgi:TolA-binding protein
LINAGDEWSAGGEAKSAQKTPNERAEPDVEAAPSYEDAAEATSTEPRQPDRAIATTSSSTSQAGSGAPPDDAAARQFRALVTAFNGGDYGTAARGFSHFVGRYPRDPRAEDAAYLRVVALSRIGDASGAELAAKQYLRSYPEGFRRDEVAQLISAR